MKNFFTNVSSFNELAYAVGSASLYEAPFTNTISTPCWVEMNYD